MGCSFGEESAWIESYNVKCERDRECMCASSLFRSETYEVSCIFAYHSKDNDDAIHIPCNVVVHDIAMKVKPWRLVLPMSMVDFVNVNLWDFWIFNAQAILRGIGF